MNEDPLIRIRRGTRRIGKGLSDLVSGKSKPKSKPRSTRNRSSTNPDNYKAVLRNRTSTRMHRSKRSKIPWWDIRRCGKER